ncbi:MAG: hypothetical protein WC107_06070 [Patescibacteria group bacterium]
MKGSFWYLWLSVCLFAGCGGGGGNNIPADSTATATAHITVPADQSAVSAQIADLTISIPVGAISSGTRVDFVLRPWNGNTGRVEPIAGSAELEVTMNGEGVRPGKYIEVKIGQTRADGDWKAVAQLFIDGKWHEVSSVERYSSDTVYLDGSSLGVRRGLVSTIKGIIGRIRIPEPDSEVDFVPAFASDPNAETNTKARLFHGFISNKQTMEKLARKLYDTHHYRQIDYVTYPWPDDIEATADLITYKLMDDNFRGVKSDFHCHSMGGLVMRSAIQDKTVTNAVHDLFMICTPNEGSGQADLAGTVRNIHNAFLNNDSDWWPLVTSKAVRQLMTDSEFLSKLNNSSNVIHRGRYGTVLFGGAGDSTVDWTSALATSTSLESFTLGPVWRLDMSGMSGFSHSSLIQTDAGLNRYIQEIQRVWGVNENLPSLTLWTEPNPARANFGDTRWLWTIKARNDGNVSIWFQSLAMAGFGMTGVDLGASWYDPHTQVGEFFPNSYHEWNQSIYPGQVIEIPIISLVGWNGEAIQNVLSEYQARTICVVAIVYKEGNYSPVAIETRLSQVYGDLVPTGDINFSILRSLKNASPGALSSPIVKKGLFKRR